MPDLNNPLDESHLARLNKALEEITQAENLVGKMQRSGLDVGDRKELLSEQRKQITALKANFFPNQ